MKSVGMRRKSWFRTAGVVAFAAEIVGSGGVAGAADNTKTCVPTPAFVNGTDFDYTSLTPANITGWTNSAGYGWSEGANSEVAYEVALSKNTDTGRGAEIIDKWVTLSYSSTRSMPLVDGIDGMRVGFDYNFTDPLNGLEAVSQILQLNFDDGSPTSSWSMTPPMCSSSSSGNCANDPAADPSTWISFKPVQVQPYQKITNATTHADSNSSGWSHGDMSWVLNHTRVWIWADTSVSPTKYYWRMNMALPIRTTGNDPSASWTSQSIYLDPNSFVATSGSTVKFVPNFWTEMLTDATDKDPSTGLVPKIINHFPDWSTASEAARDSNNVPAKSAWGQAEVGSPRGAGLLNGDLSCAGQGLLIAESTGDNVLYDSAIWNNKGGANGVGGLFGPAGTLYMANAAGAQLHNNMSVLVQNLGGAAVDPKNVHAQFLVAPYGSQSIQTVWSPLNLGNPGSSTVSTDNDFTCPGGTATNNASCSPLPKAYTPIDSTPHDSTLMSLTQGNTAQWDMASDWVPAASYVCATQVNEQPGSYSWFWQTLNGPGQLCANPTYKPSDSGVLGNGPATGLPAHQCMQVKLSGNNVQFAINSAFRNMHAASASLYREAATIDTKGLAKVAGQSYHNVYLYVETKNMPYRVDTGYAPTTYTQTMTQYNQINAACGRGVIEKSRLKLTPNARGPITSCRGFNPNVPVPSDEYLTATMPTMIVHAYADTGVVEKINGKRVPILTPMTSFGQYITHDATAEGNVFGWDASLEPAGTTTFQKIGTDTYRLQIPNDGAGQVITHVSPLPSKRPTCTGKVNSDIVSLLQAIAPLIKLSPALAGTVNALIDSLQIQCVDLQGALDAVNAGNWGTWTSWVQYLVKQIEATDGCSCK